MTVSLTAASRPRGEFGPDFFDPNSGEWWDITLPGQCHSMSLNMGWWHAISLLKKSSMDLAKRWQTLEGAKLQQEILERLLAGKPLHDLNLGRHEGRLDLRGLSVPRVAKQDLPPFRNWSVQKLTGQLKFKNARFQDLDLSDSQLGYCLFFHTTITNCRFDRTNCEYWKLWATDVTRSTFVGANLRGAALGPWYEGRGCIYKFVDFSRADMRYMVSTTATYRDSDFSYARLEKIDFQSSSFVRCRFAGELREVMFYDRGFKTGKPDPNPMEDIDFSKAKLRLVEFRRLNLDRVRLPNHASHLVVGSYRCVLEQGIAKLRESDSVNAKSLAAVLRNRLKWIGPKQEIGIFSRLDFLEWWGIEGEQFAVELLRQVEQECAKTSL